MYVTHCPMVIHSCDIYCMTMSKESCGPNTKPCQKPNFHLEVKGQCRIGIMNVRNTSSLGNTPMCQIR